MKVVLINRFKACMHGELEEEGSWRDLFRLSRLEERKETLERLLEEASVE